nr:phosphoglycerate kinase, cytosolic-like isoform X1 [Ipomoea batatas]
MKEEFSKYGKGKLAVENLDKAAIHKGGWLKENPLGIQSDWEQHVLDRGHPMYRLCHVCPNQKETAKQLYHVDTMSHEPHFQWVGYRSFSKVVAREANSESGCEEWFDLPPPSLGDYIAADSMN